MDDFDAMPVWERRFRAPAVMFPSWAREAPDRLVLASNETGVWQLYAWDRGTGARRRVTDLAVGVTIGGVTPEGADVVWFDDPTGGEVGTWVTQPFHGGEVRPLVDGVPPAWIAGIALAPGVVVVGTAGDDGFSVYRSLDGSSGEVLHRHTGVVEVSGLSWDGRLLAIAHAEHGDSLHLALRVLDVASGDTVGDLWDGPGLGLVAAAWSRVPGDTRVAIVSERAGRATPGIWDVATGDRADLDTGLEGDVTVVDWWPDASALLLACQAEGRDRLFRHDVDTGVTTPVEHPDGSVLAARVRPGGDVWLHLSRGHLAPVVLTLPSGDEVVPRPGAPAPEGYPYRSWHFTNPAGQRVHGFVVAPPAEGPHPLVMLVHGGPHWLWSDAWRPEIPAWVDHGFAVALVNYRGSTGYGREWRDSIIGNPGLPEVEDIVAGVDDLVASGRVDPTRVVLSGASWGGYVTLLGLGLRPDRWAAGIAVVPVADYVAAFEDEAPELRSMDRVLFGGTPDEIPAEFAERSPITYAERVRAPLLLIAGNNDSRCPIRQVLNYVERLEAAGADYQLHRYDAGHGAMVVEERVRHMSMELGFVLRRLGVTTGS